MLHRTGIMTGERIRRFDTFAGSSSESPSETRTKPVALQRSVGERPELLGVKEHSTTHQVHIHTGKNVGNTETQRHSILARDANRA
jgi:hypothetical protein